jgi:hypothetical protein
MTIHHQEYIIVCNLSISFSALVLHASQQDGCVGVRALWRTDLQLKKNELLRTHHPHTTSLSPLGKHVLDVSGPAVYRSPLVFCPRLSSHLLSTLARSGLSAHLAPSYIACSLHRTNNLRVLINTGVAEDFGEARR